MTPLTVVLASASPRRSQLLAEAGVEFSVLSVSVDELLDPELLSKPQEACKKLAERKAGATVQEILAQGVGGPTLVLGSDTMVVLGSRIYGKPEDDDEAVEMILSLAGKTYEVVTGVAVCQVRPDGPEGVRIEEDSFLEASYVTFRNLTREEALEYVACGESADKAGAYAIQGEGAHLVERFEGDYDNIVGLPVGRLMDRYPCLRDPEA